MTAENKVKFEQQANTILTKLEELPEAPQKTFAVELNAVFEAFVNKNKGLTELLQAGKAVEELQVHRQAELKTAKKQPLTSAAHGVVAMLIGSAVVGNSDICQRVSTFIVDILDKHHLLEA